MNKSIILVMCDILVLSAMSLSEGGFTIDGFDVRLSQVDDDSVFVSKVEYDELEQLMRSKERLAAAAKREAADADAKRKAAESDAARARSEAETAKRGEIAARNEAEAAKKGEAHARSEAETARAGEVRAMADAKRANGQAAAAKREAENAHKELADIKRRQRMLKGKIPAGFVRKLQFKIAGKQRQSILYSPVLKIDDQCYAMFEINRLGVDSVDDIENVTAEIGFTNSFRSVAFQSKNNSKLFFVHVPNADQDCAIQCGVETAILEDNLVFYVESGNCHGNPVPCSKDANGLFTCSIKTETRTPVQIIFNTPEESHSVYEGCFLISAKCGALLGIVRRRVGRLGGPCKCEIIRPVTKLDLVPLTNDPGIKP